jgi:hypothetical protein
VWAGNEKEKVAAIAVFSFLKKRGKRGFLLLFVVLFDYSRIIFVSL